MSLCVGGHFFPLEQPFDTARPLVGVEENRLSYQSPPLEFSALLGMCLLAGGTCSLGLEDYRCGVWVACLLINVVVQGMALGGLSYDFA